MRRLAAALALLLGLSPAADAAGVVAPRVTLRRAPAAMRLARPLPAGLALSALAPRMGTRATARAVSAAPAAAGSLALAVPSAARASASAPAPRSVSAAAAAARALAAAAEEPSRRKGSATGSAARDESSENASARAAAAFDGASDKEDADAISASGAPAFGLRQALAPSRRRPAAARKDAEKEVDEEGGLELALRYAGVAEGGLMASHISGDFKLIKPTPGSKRWWSSFKKGTTIRVGAGTHWLFQTQVTDAVTKPIGKVTKADLKGIFTDLQLLQFPIATLRKAMIERLVSNRNNQDLVINLSTPVRVIHFKTPARLAQERGVALPAGELYDRYAPRAPLKLPADSPLRRLNEYYPKAVIVDLALFEGRIPARLVEDMGKLQRAGVKFVFFSDRAGASYAEQKRQLMDGLYAAVFAEDGGASITKHGRGGARLESEPLTPYDRRLILESARMAAYAEGVSAAAVEELAGGPAYFRGEVPARADAAAFKASLESRLASMGLPGEVIFEPEARGARSFVVQRRRVAESMPEILRALQSMGVYANPQEMLVVSEDPFVARAVESASARLAAEDGGGELRPGALRAAVDAASLAGAPLKGVELLENAVGAVLGEYRENRRNDFVTSASALDSFAHYTDRYFSQELLKGEENIYAFWGHQSHDAMNWAAWVHRNTGRAPSEDELVERFRREWDEALRAPGFAVYLPPGRSFNGVRDAAIGRLKGMYDMYRVIMSRPGAHFIGTEIPNVFSVQGVDRKTGESRRVFVRTILDFVALMPSEDGRGSELWIMDFKSGVKPTQEILVKKIQPRTYRLFTDYKWASLPREYDVAAGPLEPIRSTRLEFIYNRTAIPIPLTDWDDGRTELEILRLSKRMQQDKQRTHIRVKRKIKKKTDAAAKPARAARR